MPAPRENLARRRFGCLRVIEFDAIRNKAAYWRCECDCGQAGCLGMVTVKATRLRTGKKTDCGALGYRRDPERHKTARALVEPRKRLEIAAMGAAARVKSYDRTAAR